MNQLKRIYDFIFEILDGDQLVARCIQDRDALWHVFDNHGRDIDIGLQPSPEACLAALSALPPKILEDEICDEFDLRLSPELYRIMNSCNRGEGLVRRLPWGPWRFTLYRFDGTGQIESEMDFDTDGSLKPADLISAYVLLRENYSLRHPDGD